MTESLQPLLTTISKSRSILDLPDNWDDEGSVACKECTWRRATEFLTYNISLVSQSSNINVDVPKIYPGPDGSIDIHWLGEHHELLVNVPPDDNELATFYGDNKKGLAIKGELDTSADNSWLMVWLALRLNKDNL